MTTHHTDEKKPADAGEIEASLQELRESPRFKMLLVLGKLDSSLWMMDENSEPDREQERYNLRNRIYTALSWLSELDAKLFPEDQHNQLRTIETSHFDSLQSRSETSL